MVPCPPTRLIRRISASAAITLLLFAIGALPALELAPQTAVDRHQRESVRTYYLAESSASEGFAINWTGSTATCDPGTIASDYREATVRRINFYRVLCGLPPVGLDLAQSQKCQAMALMIHANKALSHDPPSSWSCWSSDGHEAAGKSNLARGFGASGADAVDLYMNDFGFKNQDVGHRRWLLHPPLATVGSGSTPDSNCLWVVGNGGTRPSTPGWVAWPNDGYVPYQLLPSSKRWSFTMAGANFSGATVSISADGSPLDVTVIATNGGFGDRAIVFTSDQLPTSNPGTDTTYQVHIQGIANAPVTNVSYSITVIDPRVTSASGRLITIALTPSDGATATIRDSNGTVVGSGDATSLSVEDLTIADDHRIEFTAPSQPVNNG